MKKVALISTYCDTQEKLDILSKNIDNVKVCGLDVIVISPFTLPESIQKKCDYFFLTKDNPVLDWPTKSMYHWQHLQLADKNIRITKTYSDYGWAGLYQVKKLSEIALSFEYDFFYHMIYDLKFDEVVVEGLLGEGDCNIYSSKREDTIWMVGLHFMIFNREKLKTFVEHITLENYLTSTEDDAFVWLHKLINSLEFNIIEKPVEDEIYFYEGKDFFNSSPTDQIKMFIEKNDEIDGNIKILFYDITESTEVKITIDGLIYLYLINGNSLFDLGYDKFDIRETLIEYKGVHYNITNTIKKIKHSTLNII